MDNYIADIYKTLNILCVEDDEDVLQIYKDLFSLIFNDVYFASNGIEGLECFKENKIDIILTDYMMPQCNGLEMTQKIRDIDSSIPIIMVTALESIDMLRKAIDLNITSFLKKPFTSSSLFKTFNVAVKSVIVDRCILQEQMQKIIYTNYQENLTSDKENIITKNDTADTKRVFDFQCDVVYHPKDILSGDSYLIRKINEDEYLLFLVDGMGKGISASVTAMLCSAFVNYYVNNLIETETFTLDKLIEECLKYIQPNLLEYEVISASFLHLDKSQNKLHYAIFSMPPLLYMLQDNPEVYKVKSNNIPLASYTQSFTVDSLEISTMDKILIYSDGLSESFLSQSDEPYALYLKDDFKEAENIEMLENLYKQKSLILEDDITYIFLNRREKG